MRWLSAAGKKTLDGRRPGRRIYPVAVDEAVVVVALDQDPFIASSRFIGAVVHLAVDDGVGVAAPARWRMGWRKEEAGRSAEVVVPPTMYEWGNGGEGGNLKLWDALL